MSFLAQIAQSVAAHHRPQSKPRQRVTWDETGKISRAVLTKEDGQHTLGGTCPHCNGTGRYLIHTKREYQKCYRCNGKGRLDHRDLEYLHMRVDTGAPISRIRGF